MRNHLIAVGALVTLGAVGATWPEPSLAATPHDARADKLIAGFLDAYTHAHSYLGRVEVVTHARGRTARSKYLLALEKPNHTAMTVLENPGMRAAEGTKIVWFGGPTVKLATHFFGLPIKLEPAYDDARLRGLRGDTMWDVSINRAVEMTRDPGSRFKYVRDDVLLGRKMHVVEVRSPALLKGVDHEQLWLDDKLHLPFQRDMFTGGDCVYHVAVETFQFDRPLPPDTFQVN